MNQAIESGLGSAFNMQVSDGIDPMGFPLLGSGFMEKFLIRTDAIL